MTVRVPVDKGLQAKRIREMERALNTLLVLQDREANGGSILVSEWQDAWDSAARVAG